MTLGFSSVSEIPFCWSEAGNWLCSLDLLYFEFSYLSQSVGRIARASTQSNIMLTKATGFIKSERSLPSKVLAHHLIEALVMRLVEIPQFLHHLRVDGSVRPPFCLSQAMRFTAALWLLQAGEAFCFVEIEVFVRNNSLKA